MPARGSVRLSPDVAETLNRSHDVSELVGAVVGALHPHYCVPQDQRRRDLRRPLIVETSHARFRAVIVPDILRIIGDGTGSIGYGTASILN